MRPATSSASTSASDRSAVQDDDAAPREADASVAAHFFDGRSAKAHPVRVRREGQAVRVVGHGIDRLFPLTEVRWPERTRHGPRVAELSGGAALQAVDGAAWDAFSAALGRGDSAVVRAQQSWRWVLGSLGAIVVVLAALYAWGLPALARGVVALTPERIDRAIGEHVLGTLDDQLLQPSALPADRQARVRDHFEAMLRAQPAGSVPAHRLEFRKSRIGPNAFALPGGTIVLTDELVALAGDDLDAISAVLGHELGHVRHRHGMRMLVQVGALGAVASLVLGDFSSILAGAPVILGQAAYSRDAEREADAESARMMRAAGISPLAMVRFFEKLAAKGDREPSLLGIAIGSHPADAERIEFFRRAAER